MSSRPRLRKFGFSENFYIVWAEGRRSRRISTGTRDPVEAKTALAKFEAARAAPPETFTVEDVIDAYKTAKTSKSRWAKNRDYEFRAIVDAFGAYPPSKLTAAKVRGWIDECRAAGLKRSTMDKKLRMLRAALHWAAHEGWMSTAPYIPAPGGEPPRDRWLTGEEARKLIAGAESPHIRLFIQLGLMTGARTRSILELTWDNVDFERGLVMYPPASPESRKRTAIVPMTATLRTVLEEAAEIAQTDNVIEFNGKPVQSIKTGFRKALERAEIAHCTPHDLRRTAATWMVQAGRPTPEIARLLADTEKMIERVYGHHAPDYLKGAADVLGDAVSGKDARNLRAVSEAA